MIILAVLILAVVIASVGEIVLEAMEAPRHEDWRSSGDERWDVRP